ncbi:MAG: DEAD/DEAH box helicase [Rhodospirillaceae bacterium]|nr:DEAD/DEAH box helicase [Rhodospirillaceae bacterium]
MTEFENVLPALGQALNQRGYTALTPVQEAVLDPKLQDTDVLVSAQTGSGKTVAFGLTLAPALLDGADRFSGHEQGNHPPLALAVAPTRELALQVKRELEWLYKETGATLASCVGGMDMRTERRNLQRGAHIVVGTPGRLRDHIERGSLDMTGLRAVVLDEADEMLDLGFREDLEFILGAAPETRRTLMFSATVPRTIAALAKRYQRDAVRISTQAEQSQHLDIEYRALTIASNYRENAIINVLRYYEAESALVFCGTRAAVNHMTARFNNRGFSVVALSGELSQNERTLALQAMRNGRARVCIATDVAARGIDLPNCGLVIHADMPKTKESLLHRSGRTGRAGRKGVSVLMVPHNWRKRTERLLGGARIDATWARPPTVLEIMRRDNERLLTDPSLSEPLTEEEQTFVAELLSQHSAEQVAAAFVRRFHGDRSAPEELLDTGPPEQKDKRRDDFKDGVWFSLSVGRNKQAEPRWLLPMLCKAGDITKRDIGAIRIDQAQTYVELAPGCVDRFLAAIGPEATVEKGVTVSRMDNAPQNFKPRSERPGRSERPERSERSERPYTKNKPFAARKKAGYERKNDERTVALEPDRAPGQRAEDKRHEVSKPAREEIKTEKFDAVIHPAPKAKDEKYQGKKRRDIQPWDKSEKPEKPEKTEKFDKPEKSEKSEKRPAKRPVLKAKKRMSKKSKLAIKAAKAINIPKIKGAPRPGSGPLKRRKAP